MEKHLNEFVVGQKGIVKKIEAEGKIKRRLFDMGVTPNTEIYLKKLETEFKKLSNVKKARKKFIDFTKNVWILDITTDEVGSKINLIIGKTFELDRLFTEIKTKYDVLYKESNIENNSKIMLVVAIILGVSLVFNVLNYINIIK